MNERIDRRAALRAGGAALLSLSPLLAACGTTIRVRGGTPSYAIDVTGTSPPVGDLVRAITARARAVGMAPTLTATGALGLPAVLHEQTRRGVFDPQADRTPTVEPLVAVGVVAPATIEPILAGGLRRGAKIVTYPVALATRTAAIVAPAEVGATRLADHAARWAHASGNAAATVLLVLPSADLAAVNPYATQGPIIERAVRATLAHAAPRLRVVTTTAFSAAAGRIAVMQARAARPDLEIVLVWDDATAIGAARALPAHAFAGALGAPAVTSRATFAELDRGGALKVVVAAAVADLGNALVDLPHALLSGHPPRDVTLAAHTLTPHSAALARYSRDYAHHPQSINYTSVPLNPSALEQPK